MITLKKNPNLAMGWGLALSVFLGCIGVITWNQIRELPNTFSGRQLVLIALSGALGGHTCHLWKLANGLRFGLNLGTWIRQSLLIPVIAAIAGLVGIGAVYILAQLLFGPPQGAGGNLPVLATFSGICGGFVVIREWREK